MAGIPDTLQEGPGGGRAWLIWAIAALFYLYEFFIRAAPAVMEPELQKSFGLNAGALGGILGFYYYIYAPMQLAVGPVLDRFSAKHVLVPAALVCALGCFLEVMGHSPVLLAVARLFQGLGSAFAFVGTMYLASQWFPRRRLALLSGLTTALGMVGAIAANAGIVKVVQEFGWEITLKDAGVAGLFVAVLILFLVPHRAPVNEPVSEQAAVPIRPGVLAGLKMVILNPQTWLVGIVATGLYMPLSVIGALWGIEYITTLTGETKEEASGAVSMLYVGWLIGGPFVGWLSDRIGHRRLLLVAACGLTLISTGLLLLFDSMPLWQVYSLMLVIGLFSCPQVISFVVAVEHNPRPVSGTAIAVTNMMVMLFGGLGMALFGVLLDWFAGSPAGASDVYPPGAYKQAMLLLPAVNLLGVVAALVLRESINNDKPDFVEQVG